MRELGWHGARPPWTEGNTNQGFGSRALKPAAADEKPTKPQRSDGAPSKPKAQSAEVRHWAAPVCRPGGSSAAPALFFHPPLPHGCSARHTALRPSFTLQ